MTITSDNRYICVGTNLRTLVFEMRPEYWAYDTAQVRNYMAQLKNMITLVQDNKRPFVDMCIVTVVNN